MILQYFLYGLSILPFNGFERPDVNNLRLKKVDVKEYDGM